MHVARQFHAWQPCGMRDIVLPDGAHDARDRGDPMRDRHRSASTAKHDILIRIPQIAAHRIVAASKICKYCIFIYNEDYCMITQIVKRDRAELTRDLSTKNIVGPQDTEMIVNVQLGQRSRRVDGVRPPLGSGALLRGET